MGVKTIGEPLSGWQAGGSSLLIEVQGTKKFRSDSPGLVDFVVRLVEFILHLPDGRVKVFGKIFL